MIIVVTVVLIIDTSLIRISDFITGQTNASWRVVTFFIIGSICAVGQGVVLGFVKQKVKSENTRRLDLRVIHKIVTAVQYILIAIFVSIFLQITLTSHYDTVIVDLSVIFSYTLSIIMMGLLTKWFISWFKLNRNSVVLFYGLASATLALSAIFVLILVVAMSPAIPKEVGGHYGAMSSSFGQSTELFVLNYGFVVSSITSFSLLWIATVLLLNHYSERIGKVGYWIIVSIL